MIDLFERTARPEPRHAAKNVESLAQSAAKIGCLFLLAFIVVTALLAGGMAIAAAVLS